MRLLKQHQKQNNNNKSKHSIEQEVRRTKAMILWPYRFAKVSLPEKMLISRAPLQKIFSKETADVIAIFLTQINCEAK